MTPLGVSLLFPDAWSGEFYSSSALFGGVVPATFTVLSHAENEAPNPCISLSGPTSTSCWSDDAPDGGVVLGGTHDSLQDSDIRLGADFDTGPTTSR